MAYRGKPPHQVRGGGEAYRAGPPSSDQEEEAYRRRPPPEVGGGAYRGGSPLWVRGLIVEDHHLKSGGFTGEGHRLRSGEGG